MQERHAEVGQRFPESAAADSVSVLPATAGAAWHRRAKALVDNLGEAALLTLFAPMLILVGLLLRVDGSPTMEHEICVDPSTRPPRPR